MTRPTDPAHPLERRAGLDTDALADEIDHRIRALPAQTIQPIRAVRRAYSKRLRSVPAEVVVALAVALVDRQRWVAYELVYHHPGGPGSLGVEEVERLGRGMEDWGSVDAFGCSISGPATPGAPSTSARGWLPTATTNSPRVSGGRSATSWKPAARAGRCAHERHRNRVARFRDQRLLVTRAADRPR